MTKKGSPYEKFVASVVEAMDDTVHVEHSKWVEGPDGRRDMDVHVTGLLNGRDFSILIECKDYDPNKTGKVGIEYVDALDSKRRDLNIDQAMICSNSGFTEGALRKAKRKSLGMISVLKAGDKSVKVEIKEVFYIRKIKPSDLNIRFRFERNGPSEVDIESITFEGLQVQNWILNQIWRIYSANFSLNPLKPVISDTLSSTCDFKSPAKVDFGGIPYEVIGIDFDFHFETQWFSQIYSIDASLGIYDHIRKKVQIGGPGPVQYTVKDFNPYNGVPINFVPDEKDLGEGRRPGEVEMKFTVIEGFMVDEEKIPNLDDLIVPEDLVLEIKDIN